MVSRHHLSAFALLIVFLVACSDAPSAPDSARLELVLPGRLEPGAAAVLHAILRYETDDRVEAGWRVDLEVNRGRIAATDPGDHGGAIAHRATTDALGTTTVYFRAPLDTGWVVVRARAGSALAVDSLKVEPKQSTDPI